MAIRVERIPVRVGRGAGTGFVHHKSDNLFRETFLREVAQRDMALQLRLETTAFDKRAGFVFQPHHRQRLVSQVMGPSAVSPAMLPTRVLLEKLFTAYCGFLADKAWVYESSAGVNKSTLSEAEIETIHEFYERDVSMVSPFMLPGRPHLNCMEAAHGLVYAMTQIRIKPESIWVVMIRGEGRNEGVIFRGFEQAMGIARHARYRHLADVGLTVSVNGGRLNSTPTTQDSIDSPFDNHFFVECDGMYWDPTYGIAFPTIDWVFTTCREWPMLDPIGGEDTRTKDVIYHCPNLHTWVAVLNTEARSARARAVLANPIAGRFLFANEHAVTRRLGVEGGTVAVPVGLWRVMADGIPALRDCLTRAVSRYESDSAFWRTPSDESKRALWAIRKYLGRHDLAGLSTKKRSEYYPDQITQDATLWTDEQAADFTERALAGTAGVGKRLGEAIKKACQGNAAVASLFA